jgi:hypothetical protein
MSANSQYELLKRIRGFILNRVDSSHGHQQRRKHDVTLAVQTPTLLALGARLRATFERLVLP